MAVQGAAGAAGAPRQPREAPGDLALQVGRLCVLYPFFFVTSVWDVLYGCARSGWGYWWTQRNPTGASGDLALQVGHMCVITVVTLSHQCAVLYSCARSGWGCWLR
jgi:hypothetical protein